MKTDKAARTAYSLEQMARAIAVVTCYGHAEKIARFDDVNRDQPYLLGAAVQLTKIDPPLPLPMVDHVLDILLVFYELTTQCNPDFPQVRYDCVSKEFQRIGAMQRFLNSETEQDADLWSQQSAKNHREQNLFAWLVAKMLDCFGDDKGQNAETARRCCIVMMNACVRTKWDD
jgi:hypothetical protein